MEYKKIHKKGMELPMRIVRYFVTHAELDKKAQGQVSIKCSKLWDMSPEEFKEIFNIDYKDLLDKQ